MSNTRLKGYQVKAVPYEGDIVFAFRDRDAGSVSLAARQLCQILCLDPDVEVGWLSREFGVTSGYQEIDLPGRESLVLVDLIWLSAWMENIMQNGRCTRSDLGEFADRLTIEIRDQFEEEDFPMLVDDASIALFNDLALENHELRDESNLWKAMADTTNLFDMGEVAKTLSFPSIGRNKLFKILRHLKILRNRDDVHRNEPYQRYVTDGWFAVRLVHTGIGMVTKTFVTGKGIEKIRDQMLECYKNGSIGRILSN